MKAGGDDKPAARAHRRSADSTGWIDMLGIVSASQALSSETDIDGLHARVTEILGAMTGATGVHLLRWRDEQQDWLSPADRDGQQALPMSVLRHVRCWR